MYLNLTIFLNNLNLFVRQLYEATLSSPHTAAYARIKVEHDAAPGHL